MATYSFYEIKIVTLQVIESGLELLKMGYFSNLQRIIWISIASCEK